MSAYINIRRIHDRVHDGEVNVPFGTPFEVDEDGFLYTMNGETKVRFCFEKSERAYRDFAYNADGCGEERKDLIKQCIRQMQYIDKDNAFVNFIYDPTFMKYKKHPLDVTEWSWDREKVHKAPISDLKYMLTCFKSMPKIILRY